MDEKLLSIKEAAKLLNVCENTLRDWDIEGKLPAARSKGGHRRYSLDQVRGYLDKNPPKEEPMTKSISETKHLDQMIEVWEKSGMLSDLDKEEKGVMAVLLENAKLASGLNTNPLLSTSQLVWLTRESWMRCRFRKMVSVQPLLGPCGLVFFYNNTHKSAPGHIDSDAVASKTLKYDFKLFTKAKFESIKEVYADTLAMGLEIHIFEHLPKLSYGKIQDVLAINTFAVKFSEIYDYIIAPEHLIEDMEKCPAFEGLDLYGINLCLDPETFEPRAAAGRYPKNTLTLPIFAPFITVFDTGCCHVNGTMPVLMRAGWLDQKKEDNPK
jgi:excisionase family DNA binding protein